ncbi:uncharacterized protein METZ01_LOCUS204972, partial [marine metagenome]
LSDQKLHKYMTHNILSKILRQSYTTAVFVLSFLLMNFNITAQIVSSTEIGIMGSNSYYLGDINTKHFDYMMPSGGIVIRNNIDRRVVLKGEILYGWIRGD